MANLIIDLGNTALKACWSDGITLGKTFRYQGERFIDFILTLTEKVKPEVMLISSSREITQKNESKLIKECSKLVIMDAHHKEAYAGWNIPEYISSDRMASVVAARFLFKDKPISIVDCGNTLSFDFIDASGSYVGGNVSLGCRTRFKALNRYSKSLPLLDTPEDIPASGTCLEDSVQAGVIRGMLFEIEGYLSERHENIVVFTGGDAIYFAKKMKNSIFVVCNLVLMGLAIIADKYE